MKVAVLGCGSIGRRHIKNLQSLNHEVIAWNRGEKRATQASSDFNINVYYGDNKETMFNEHKFDAAFICTPNSSHIEDAIFAAKRKCHLFIEKPVSHNLKDIDKLEDIAIKNSLITQVGANLRYDFGPKFIYDHVSNGKIGRVLWAYFHGGMHLPDWHPNDDYRKMYSAQKSLGGGAVLDFIHEIDLIFWFFGGCENIIGRIMNTGTLEIETEDIADALFLYPDKNVCLHVDYLQRPFQRGIKVLGEKGWCEWSLVDDKISLYDKNGTHEIISTPKNYSKNAMYVKQAQHFFNCLKLNKSPDSNLASGIRALKGAMTIKQKGL